MTKQPSYRFAGHTEPWEEKKLGEVAESLDYGLNASAKEFDGVNKYIRITDIDDFSNEFLKTNLTSPDVKIDESSDYLLSEGDILFARTGASTGKTYYYKKTDGVVFFAGFLIRARIKEDNDYKFIFQNTLTKKFKKYVDITSQRSGQPGVNAKEYANFLLSLPSLPEQTAIGAFFQDIDQLISLQQRKLEVLKEQKKTYLKLLFPAKGQTKPALRFAGFEDEWKEVKVSDIFRVTRGQVLATTEISEEKTDTHKYPVYSSQTKNEGLLGYYDKYLFETAITWTTDGANAGTVNYREGKFYSTNVNGVLLSDEGFANKVIAEILNNEAWKYVSKVGNPKLMNNVMSEISLVIPNDFREISTLSTFFQDLDKAIAKQEEKVNQLKESKQTLLRKMFI